MLDIDADLVFFSSGWANNSGINLAIDLALVRAGNSPAVGDSFSELVVLFHCLTRGFGNGGSYWIGAAARLKG